MSKTSRQPASPCPDCGKNLNAATALESDAVPEPGDMGICFGCQGVHVFTDTMGRRRPTEAEIALLPLDVLSRYQRVLTEFRNAEKG